MTADRLPGRSMVIAAVLNHPGQHMINMIASIHPVLKKKEGKKLMRAEDLRHLPHRLSIKEAIGLEMSLSIP